MSKAVSPHWLPHKNCRFEGYYSKFRLASGNHLALIVCSVHHAPKRPHMLSMTYVLSYENVRRQAIQQCVAMSDIRRSCQREVWLGENVYKALPDQEGFTVQVGEHGTMYYKDDKLDYHLSVNPDAFNNLPGFELSCKSVSDTREPYLAGDAQSTPAGLFTHLPLPIQWHVQALNQRCDVSLSLKEPSGAKDAILDACDEQGRAVMHQEKNWAASFPKGYLWVQSWSGQGADASGLCLAGGEALPGIQAYLITYRPSPEGIATARSGRRDAGEAFTFRPPFSMSLFGYSPFLQVKRRWVSPSSDALDQSTCTFDLSTFRQRLVLTASADKQSFFTLSAPLPEGHRPGFCTQSFEAELEIKAYRRTWPWQAWTLVSQETRGDVSLEFGGAYYPEAGDKQW